MAVTAEQDQVVRIERDLWVIDILRSDRNFVVHCVAMPDDSFAVAFLAEAAHRLDVRPAHRSPCRSLVKITRKIPRQANLPSEKIGMKKAART